MAGRAYRRVRCRDCKTMFRVYRALKAVPVCRKCRSANTSYVSNGAWTAPLSGGRTKVIGSKDLAEAAIAKDAIRQAERKAGINRVEEVCVGVVLDLFEEWQDTGVKSRMYEMALPHLKRHFPHHLNVSALTQADIEKYKANRTRQKAKPATINKELTALSRALRLFAPEHAHPKIVKLDEDNERVRRLTLEEKTALLKAAQLAERPPVTLAAIMIGICTGLRRSNVVSLKWADVDFGTNRLTAKLVKKKKTVRVSIPMHSALREAMLNLKEYNEGKGYGINSEWCFPSPKCKGKHIRSDSNFGFESAVKRAKIKDLHFHDLRHTFSTYFAEATGDLGALQSILGHTSPAMTKRYVHYSDEHHQSRMQELEDSAFFQ